MPSASPRILVIRRRYLGDIVLLGSFFRNLRLHWPSARVSALVEPAYAAVLSLNPDVDSVLTLPRKAGQWLSLLRELRRERFSHVFDLDNSDKTALLTRCTSAPFRATLELENVRRHFPGLYTRRSFVDSVDYSSRPITETYLSLLATADVPVTTREVRLIPRAEDILAIQPLINGSSPKLLVHPGSRSSYRVWPVENFAAVCDRVQNELGARVFLIGGPADRPLVDSIGERMKTPASRLAPLNVPQFAALAGQFDAMLCHDSGPMHLAAAVGTAVVALFGSQNATVWGPTGSQHAVLQAPLPCRHCVNPQECVPGDSYRNYCVRNVTVEEVFDTVREKLARKRAAKP